MKRGPRAKKVLDPEAIFLKEMQAYFVSSAPPLPETTTATIFLLVRKVFRDNYHPCVPTIQGNIRGSCVCCQLRQCASENQAVSVAARSSPIKQNRSLPKHEHTHTPKKKTPFSERELTPKEKGRCLMPPNFAQLGARKKLAATALSTSTNKHTIDCGPHSVNSLHLSMILTGDPFVNIIHAGML